MLLQIGAGAGIAAILINVLVAIIAGYLVYRDASDRAANETLWGVGVGVAALVLNLVGVLIVVLIYYFLEVRD